MANSSSWSTNASIRSVVSSPRPTARVSAAISLRLIAADVVAVGIDPRVPQKRTRTPSAPLEGGQARRRRRRHRLPHRGRSEEHTSELQSRGHLVCRLLLEKKKKTIIQFSPCKKKNKNNPHKETRKNL